MSQRLPRIAVRVDEVAEVTPLVKRIHLRSADGAPLPSFSGGAHIILEMQDGDTLRRNAYSLMSSPLDASGYAISVRRDEAGRGGSRYLHDHATPGVVLHISPPANLFPLVLRARRHLFVAGGIGITPFLAMTEQLSSEHRDFELHYAIRSAEQGAYAADLRSRFGNRVSVYESGKGERIPLERVLVHQPLGTHLYVCGPERMIDAALGLAAEIGWPSQSVHHERFMAPAVGEPYQVRLERSGLMVEVGSHQSMLDAIEAAGVDAPSLCRGGACGQCEAAVLEYDGRLLHADHVLSDDDKASGKKIMPCVSRFQGTSLVLDL